MPTRVLRRLRGEHVAAHLYAWIAARYANSEGKSWPKRETLADDLGVSVKSIERALEVLRDHGLLETTRRHHPETGHVLGMDYELIFAVRPDADQSDTRVVQAPSDTGVVQGGGQSDKIDLARTTPVSPLYVEPDPMNQIQEEEGEAAAAAALPLEVSGSPPDPSEAFVALWHTETTDPLPRCLKLTLSRRRHIRQRLIDRPLAEWAHVFELVQASAFCRGRNDRGWRADLDWIIGSPDVALKILEGKYDDRPGTERPFTAQELTEAKRVRAGWFGGCQHDPPCANYHNCVAVIIRKWRGEAA